MKFHWTQLDFVAVSDQIVSWQYYLEIDLFHGIHFFCYVNFFNGWLYFLDVTLVGRWQCVQCGFE